MTAVAVGFALALALAAPAAPPAQVQANLAVPPVGPAHAGDTRCAFCHTPEDWKRVTFAHDKTGFALTGRHREVTCSACHPRSEFSRPIPKACAACHRDVHLQRLGQRCDRCHDTGSFKQASFGPGDHRKTAFPLEGRHAFLPCTECHGDARDRDFRRGTAPCAACHQKDFDRTAADPTKLNHVAAGFPADCRGCHGPWRFTHAFFAAHEACFALRTGVHAGISCRGCHTGGYPVYVAGQPMTCSPTANPPSAQANCMASNCHGNPAAAHSGVAGYLPSNPRCYECHRFAAVLPRMGGGVR